jgi:nucleotide-binding universal stress UspA family protein
MIRTIMVPLDGSEMAEAALPHACLLATEARGTVLLARVVPGGPSAAGEEAARAEAEAYLGHVHRHLSATRFAVRTHVATGSPAETLVSLAAQHGAHLIAMGTHGRSGLNRILLGSVADAVLRATALPVLLVSAAHRPPVQLGGYRRLLIPLDGTPASEDALRFMVRSRFAPAARLFLMHAVAPHLVYSTAPLGDMPAQYLWQQGEEIDYQIGTSQSYLQAVARSYPGRSTEALQVPILEPAAAILGAAHAQDVDAIVMVTQARVAGDGLLDGSVAAEVLYGMSVPVLLLAPMARRAT